MSSPPSYPRYQPPSGLPTSSSPSSSSPPPRRPPPLSDSPPLSPLPSDVPPSSSSSLSPAEVDRHLEARLQSLSSRPVAVYLSTPSTSQLHSRLQRLMNGEAGAEQADAPTHCNLEERLHRLSRGEAAAGPPASHEELEQRLRRLQGEEADSKAVSPAVPVRAAAARPSPAMGEVGEEEDVESLLKQLNDEARLDLAEVQRVSQLLAQPLRKPTSTSSTSSSTTPSRSAQPSPPPPVNIDDPRVLMEQLQSLPSTAVLQLKQQAGRAGQRGEEEEEEDSEERDAAEADDIVRQALDEARMTNAP